MRGNRSSLDAAHILYAVLGLATLLWAVGLLLTTLAFRGYSNPDPQHETRAWVLVALLAVIGVGALYTAARLDGGPSASGRAWWVGVAAGVLVILGGVLVILSPLRTGQDDLVPELFMGLAVVAVGAVLLVTLLTPSSRQVVFPERGGRLGRGVVLGLVGLTVAVVGGGVAVANMGPRPPTEFVCRGQVGPRGGWGGGLVAVSAEEAWVAVGWQSAVARLADGTTSLYHLTPVGTLQDLAATLDETPSEADDVGEFAWGTVHGLGVAADGTVWVAFDVGVFSFDGAGWTRRSDGGGSSLAAAPEGAVWIGGDLGSLIRWNGGTSTAVNPPVQGPPVEYFGPLAALPGGEVWAAVRTGTPVGDLLMQFDGQSVRTFQWDGTTMRELAAGRQPAEYPATVSPLSDVEAAPAGEVWAALWICPESRPIVVRFDDGSWTTYEPPFGSQPDLAVGPDGRVWFAVEDGLASFDGSDWTWEVEGRPVGGVDVAPDGTVWYQDAEGIRPLP